MLKIIFTTLPLLLLTACMSPNEAVGIVPGRLQILYKGITHHVGWDAAAFTLYNDSTSSISYFAYSPTSILYGTEALTDTGWTRLMYGWCGTGASYYELAPHESIDFETTLPQESCTWRVFFQVSENATTPLYTLRSNLIEYYK